MAIAQACGVDVEDWRRQWVEATGDGGADSAAADRSEAGGAGAGGAAAGGAAAGGAGAGGAGAGGPPAELPHLTGGFTGRSAELARLDALADPGQADPVTACLVHGIPGVGKTALAVSWAHRAAARYPDGQLFLDLRGHHPHLPPLPAGEALELLLQSLGVPANRLPAGEAAQARLYRTLLSRRQVLVVLDDAVSAAAVRPLLPGAAGSFALITSRGQLAELVAYDGLHHLALDVLEPAQSRAVLARAAGARQVAAEPAAAAQLCRLCGHLPLALRVVGALLALVPGRSLASLLAELAAGEGLAALRLAGGEPAVQDAFDLSYRALPEPARRVFRLCGLLPGPDAGAGAVAALAGLPPDEAAGQIGTLVAGNLLEEHRPGRYQLHDLLRKYAAARAAAEDSPPDRAAALARLLDRYAATAHAVSTALYPGNVHLLASRAGEPPAPMTSDEALAWLQAERANLIAAVLHAARCGPASAAWELVDLLWVVFLRRLSPADLVRVAEAALHAAQAVLAGPAAAEAAEAAEAARAAMHFCLGWAHWAGGRHDEAGAHFGVTLETYRRQGNVSGEVAALRGLTAVCGKAGRLDEAYQHCSRALDLHRDIGDRHGEATLLCGMGIIALQQGRLHEAAGCFLASLDVQRAEGNQGNVAVALANLAYVASIRGETGTAQARCAEALAAARQVGDRYGEVLALVNLAIASAAAGDHRGALTTAEAAAAGARDLGDLSFEATARDTLGTACRRLGQPNRAARHRRAALRAARTAGDRCTEAEILVALAADALTGAGPAGNALPAARKAVALARETGNRLVEAEATTILAAATAAHLAAGLGGGPAADPGASTAADPGATTAADDPADPAAGAEREPAAGGSGLAELLSTAERAVRFQAAIGACPGEARARIVLGNVLHLCGDRAGACRQWTAAAGILAATGAPAAAAVQAALDRGAPIPVGLVL